MRRRKFLQKAAEGTLIAGITGSHFAILGCTAGKEYDLVITHGMVYDGTGSPGRELDIAIKNDRIVKIRSSLNENKANEVINASGKAVCPGFIDPHTHTDVHLIINPKAESKIRQGVTTEIGGNCGFTNFPLNDKTFEEQREHYEKSFNFDLDWMDIHGFFDRLSKTGMALNFATLLGHGNLRDFVMGPYDRPPTTEELSSMRTLMGEHMKAGVFGLSTGLEYKPGSFAQTDEIMEICREIPPYGGVYATHMRSEGDTLIESIDEAISISREANVSLQVSHFKAFCPENWHKLDEAISKIERAKKELEHVLADRYSYHAASTGLDYFFPLWAREGTTEDFINRLKDKSIEEKLRTFIEEKEKKLGSWDKVLISSVVTEGNERFVGKTILEAAQETRKPCYEFIRGIIIEEENRVNMIVFAMSEDNLKRVLSHPLVVIGSDGNSLAPYGVLGEGKPHPRSYGTFPRVLGKYVREDKLFPLETGIQKMTGLTAEKFGLTHRGFLREGYFADVVIVNPDTVIDRATWTEPHTYPDGIDYVIVNGQVVIRQGEHTGKLPGRILKKTV